MVHEPINFVLLLQCTDQVFYLGEQAMAKALVASRLYQAMALEAADDDLDVEISNELDGYSKVFEDICKSGVN